MISCPRAHDVPAPNKTCGKMLIEETFKSWSWYCLTLLYNMMGSNPYKNSIMNAQLKWWVPVRSLPSMKASTMAWGITKAATVGIKNWFKRGLLPLSSSMWENKLLYSSASDIMAIKHNKKSANAKNAVKAAALAPLAMVAVSTKSLMLLGTLHLLEDLWRLMATSARRRPKNTRCAGAGGIIFLLS